MISTSPADYLKLHFIVLLWGLTGVLGEIIDLPAVELVLYRTSIAAITLAVILRHRLRINRLDILRLMATGGLIGLHWVLFFLAVKIANVSVCMVGVATVSLWTALLEPVMVPGRRVQRDDLLFGTLVIGAVALIFQSELQYASGFLVAIGAAFVGATFSILNGRFVTRIAHRVIAAYEMAGAAIVCAVCLPISAQFLSEGRGLDLIPSPRDWAALLVLAMLCTVYAYSEYVELLKRMTVFSINFANNLEPVYGLALAAIFFGEYRSLGLGFYAGAALIAGLVLVHTRRSRRKPVPVG